MKKYIIGLGCSWTQGEGGYPEEIWKQYNGSPQRALRCKDDYAIRHYEHENSWVNVLCRDHFPEYEPVNLGVKGIGNRAAVGQLHFCDKVDFNNSTGIIVLMLSGFERLDLFQQYPYGSTGQNDLYSNNQFRHYKWRTAWPIPNHSTGDSAYWDVYGRELWSEQFVAAHQMCNLLDLQTFAKAYGYKVVVANGFNQRREGIKQYLRDNAGYLVDKFDWSTYVHETTPYTAFVQKLVELDGLLPPQDWGSFHQYYSQRDWPAKYLTNCEGAHPTIDGYKVIGSELAEFIKSRGYV
jgi:hypothetical protein